MGVGVGRRRRRSQFTLHRSLGGTSVAGGRGASLVVGRGRERERMRAKEREIEREIKRERERELVRVRGSGYLSEVEYYSLLSTIFIACQITAGAK